MATSTEEKKVKIIADGRQAEASINQITKATRLLNAERNKEKVGSDRYKQLTKDLDSMNARLKTARNEVAGLDKGAKLFGSNFKSTLTAIVGANLLGNLTNGVKNLAQATFGYAIELSDAYANIKRVTGLTDQQVKQLDETLLNLNTRTSANDLRQLAIEAGKLGIEGVDNIAKFVKEADQIKVALGEDLGEEAITQIGRLSKMFNVSMLEIGSAINEIGAQSAATEAFQVDFLNRMAGTGPTAKIAADELLGYSATLENLGQSAEVSGTALSKFFIDFIKDVEKFGQIAGMQKGQITEIFNSKGTNAAFMAFLENLNKSKNGSVELARALDEMGIDGARSTGVFLALANNTAEVAKQQGVANKAIKEGTSLTNEFNTKNTNLAATWEKFKKSLKEFALNNEFSRALAGFAGRIFDLFTTTKTANEEFAEMIYNEKQMQIAMNASIDTLKNSNLSQDARKMLIDDINKQYGEYLPYLLTEKSTIEEITKAQNEANKAFQKKILLQTYEKELADATKKLIDANKALALSEIEKGKAAQDGFDNMRKQAGFTKNLKNEVTALDAINLKAQKDAQNTIAAIQETYQKLSKDMFGEDITSSGSKSSSNTGQNSTPVPGAPSKSSLNKMNTDLNAAEQMLKEYERNITLLKIDSEYERQKKAVELEYQSELDRIGNLQISEEKKNELRVLAKQNLDETLLDMEQQRIAREDALREKQDNKEIAAAEKKAEKEEDIEKEKQERLKELRKDSLKSTSNELRQMAFTFLEQEQDEKYNRLLTELENQKQLELSNSALTQEQKEQINRTYDEKRRALLNEQAKKEKELAIFRIAVETAVAAVSALKTDPTGVLSALIIAQGLAQTALVAAKEVPQFAYGGNTMVKGSTDGKLYNAENIGSFSSGGAVNNASVGLIGEKGAELVIPNWLYTMPSMVDTMSALEGMIYARNFAGGGNTVNNSVNSTIPSEVSALIAANTKTMALLNKQLQSGIHAKMYWGQQTQTDYEKFVGRRERVKQISEL